jgi:hypothetical protein
VIAARWGMLLVAALIFLAAFGAADPDLQPSALRLMVTSVVALLAPLFWPGIAATPARTALRVAGWSVAAACLAAIALLVFGTAQPPWRFFEACTMLALILIVTHAVAAILEWRWYSLSADANGGRELACRTAALAMTLLGSLPLWLGPAAELLSARYNWVIDAILGMSPLTHLAVASGNDLLRNQWFYQHSNLASLQIAYPDLASLFWCYAMACSILALVTLAFGRRRRPFNGTSRTHPTKEKTK